MPDTHKNLLIQERFRSLVQAMYPGAVIRVVDPPPPLPAGTFCGIPIVYAENLDAAESKVYAIKDPASMSEEEREFLARFLAYASTFNQQHKDG